MKNPTRSSSASSVRPEVAVPITMSVPAPSRLISAARPAWMTMNRVAPCARASSVSCRCRSGPVLTETPAPRWLGTVGRGRSVGTVHSSGSPARFCAQ